MGCSEIPAAVPSPAPVLPRRPSKEPVNRHLVEALHLRQGAAQTPQGGGRLVDLVDCRVQQALREGRPGRVDDLGERSCGLPDGARGSLRRMQIVSQCRWAYHCCVLCAGRARDNPNTEDNSELCNARFLFPGTVLRGVAWGCVVVWRQLLCRFASVAGGGRVGGRGPSGGRGRDDGRVTRVGRGACFGTEGNCTSVGGSTASPDDVARSAVVANSNIPGGVSAVGCSTVGDIEAMAVVVAGVVLPFGPSAAAAARRDGGVNGAGTAGAASAAACPAFADPVPACSGSARAPIGSGSGGRCCCEMSDGVGKRRGIAFGRGLSDLVGASANRWGLPNGRMPELKIARPMEAKLPAQTVAVPLHAAMGICLEVPVNCQLCSRGGRARI